MKPYHVEVRVDDGWFIGRVLERPGITTQGRSLDELVFMVRDAIALMWNEKDVQLELLVPRDAITTLKRRATMHPSKAGRRPRRPTGGIRSQNLSAR